jgi:hypothetical protein
VIRDDDDDDNNNNNNMKKREIGTTSMYALRKHVQLNISSHLVSLLSKN